MNTRAALLAQLRANPDLAKRNPALLGAAAVPVRRPEQAARPRTSGPSCVADLLPKIQQLARAHGWAGLDTYNALGPDMGVHCILVREAVLFVDLKDEGEPLTDIQWHWQEALRATGQVEVYTWTAADWSAIEARLSQRHSP